MVLGMNMTSNEPEKGWADVHPHIHPQNRLLALSLSAWKLASLMADADEPDWEKIAEVQKMAQDIENLANTDNECNCKLPEESCDVCRSLCNLIYNEEQKNGR